MPPTPPEVRSRRFRQIGHVHGLASRRLSNIRKRRGKSPIRQEYAEHATKHTKNDWLTMLRRTCTLAGAGHVIRDGVNLSASTSMDEPERNYQTYPEYRWVVCHPDFFGRRPTVERPRIPLSQVLECLSTGMTAQEIADDYPGFPVAGVPHVLRFVAAHVAARPQPTETTICFIELPRNRVRYRRTSRLEPFGQWRTLVCRESCWLHLYPDQTHAVC